MEIVGIIRELWRRKALVMVVLVLGVIAAVWTAYRIPSFQERSLSLGAATSQILVDSSNSTLVAGAQAGELETLATRARIYAQYLSSLEARVGIAADSGVPATKLAASGPFSPDATRANYDPQVAEVRSNDVVAEAAPYRLVFSAQQGVPIITVSSQAPTAGTAAKLAASAFTVLNEYVAALNRQRAKAQRIAAKRLAASGASPEAQDAAAKAAGQGVTVRQLGAPEGGIVGGRNNLALMALAFVGVVGAGLLLIFLAPGIARHWRLLDEVERITREAELREIGVKLPEDDGTGAEPDDESGPDDRRSARATRRFGRSRGASNGDERDGAGAERPVSIGS